MEDISLIDKFARKRKNSSTIVLKVQYQNNYTQQKKNQTIMNDWISHWSIKFLEKEKLVNIVLEIHYYTKNTRDETMTDQQFW